MLEQRYINVTIMIIRHCSSRVPIIMLEIIVAVGVTLGIKFPVDEVMLEIFWPKLQSRTSKNGTYQFKFNQVVILLQQEGRMPCKLILADTSGEVWKLAETNRQLSPLATHSAVRIASVPARI